MWILHIQTEYSYKIKCEDGVIKGVVVVAHHKKISLTKQLVLEKSDKNYTQLCFSPLSSNNNLGLQL